MPPDREPPADASAARAAPPRMTPTERRATVSLAGIFGLRMLGMFIVLPVLALYAETLPGGRDHALVGLALGAYGLTQAVLQVPFGWASDRWGRKPVIVAGLVIFALGSFIAAWAPTIGWTIVGRTVQGAGAISAAVIALTSDLTRDAVRTRAMAAIGMTIGATFAVSLVLGPALTAVIGVPGVFALTGVLALGAIALLQRGVPDPVATPPRHDTPAQWRRVLADRELLRLNYGIFALHAALMALFVQVPFMLRDNGVEPARHWLVYLPVLAASVALMLPALGQADRPGRGKPVFIGAVAVLFVGQALLAVAGASLPVTIAALVVFFTALQPARSDAAVARLQVRARRAQGHRRRRLLERAVPRHVRGRRRRRLAVAVAWRGRRVRLLPRAHRGLARGQRLDVGAADVQSTPPTRWERHEMASVNKVILIGNLGRDPETRYTTGGDAVTNLSIATTETWKDKSGEKQEKTEWHPVVLFGRQAEIAGEYLKKGRSVYIEGRLQTRKYTDKEGVEKYSTEVVGDRMQLLGGREGSGSGGGDAEFGAGARAAAGGGGGGGGGGGAGQLAGRRDGGKSAAARSRNRRLRRRHPVLAPPAASG